MTTDFMTRAHALRNAVNWNSNSSVEVIAEALRKENAAGQQDILRRLREPSERVRSSALSAEAEAERNPPMQPCRRCKGQGYHHGFGEDGHDPDWCDSCGGGQYELGDPAYLVRAALTAAADAIEREIKGE